MTASVARLQQQNGHAAPRSGDIVTKAEMTERGSLRWYDVARSYGFIIPDDGGPDIFLHKSVVAAYRVRPHMLERDARLKFKSRSQPGGKREAIAIALDLS